MATAAIAALTLLAVALLYLLFPSADYTGDGTLFADLVRHAGVDGSTEFHRLFLHPHHLAYGPLGTIFQRALGPPPEGVRNVEILRLVHLSSLLAAAALLVFLTAMWRATGDIAAAVLVTLLLAFSGAFWAYAVNVEVQPLVLLSLCLFLLALVYPPSTSNAGWLGLSLGFAILCHGLQVLLVVPAVLHLWPLERGKRLRAVALFASVGAAAAGIPYLLALPWTAGDSPAGALAWLRPRYGMDYMSGPVEGLSRALAGLRDVFIAPPHPVAGRANGFGSVLRLLVPGLVIGAVLLARGQRATDAGRRLAHGALWTLVAYLPLWLLWDAGNPEFLVLAVPPILAIVGVAVGRYGRTARVRRRALALLLLTVATGLVGSYHFAAVIYPQSDPWNNEPWVWTRLVTDRTGPDDLILISGVGEYRIGKFYLRYFGPRRRIILQWLVLELGSPGAAVAEVHRILAEEAARGRAVYMTSEIFFPSTVAELRDVYGFDRDAMRELFDGWRREPVALLGDFTLFALVPDPPDGAPPEAAPLAPVPPPPSKR